jgi:hypothetical protein
MAERVLENPQLSINDEIIAYVPNSLKYIPNSAKTIIKSVTVGGGAVSTVHGKDLTESTSKVIFSIKATQRNLDLIDFWLNNTAMNVIELSNSDGSFTLAFVGMSLEEIPDLALNIDDDIELTFIGDPIY